MRYTLIKIKICHSGTFDRARKRLGRIVSLFKRMTVQTLSLLLGGCTPPAFSRRRRRRECDTEDEPCPKRMLTEKFESLQVRDVDVDMEEENDDIEMVESSNQDEDEHVTVVPVLPQVVRKPWETGEDFLGDFLRKQYITSRPREPETLELPPPTVDSKALVVFNPLYPPALAYHSRQHTRDDDAFDVFENERKKKKPQLADSLSHSLWFQDDSTVAEERDDMEL